MNKIVVMGTSDRLKSVRNNEHEKILLRTDISDAAEILKAQGVDYVTLDGVYDTAQDFDELDSMLAQEVINMAQDSDILYIVPGSAVTGDGREKDIASQYENVQIIWGDPPESAMPPALLDVDTSNGYSVIPAGCLEDGMFSPRIPLIITAVDNEYLLSDIILLLSDEYGDEHEVFIGNGDSHIKTMLCRAADIDNIDHNTMIYVPPKTASIARYDGYELEGIFKRLRAPGGCPWDMEQTHESLKRYLLEECAEVLEAIDKGDMHELMDELGDVLLQVLFHATIAGERGDFSMRDVEDNLVRKLIRRHPHVFAQSDASTPQEVLKQWEEIKHEEKEDKTLTHKLKSVPKSMTALMRVQKILSRASKTNLFDEKQNNTDSIFKTVKSDIDVLEKCFMKNNTEGIKKAIGQLLFDIANLARKNEFECELALRDTTQDFLFKFEEKETKKKLENI